MRVSIVIPVSSDTEVINCIKSIDEVVEVIVSLNKPTKIVTELLEKHLVMEKSNSNGITTKICKIDYPNIAEAYNNGIKNAKYDKVLLMDSDCVFEKGCIKKLYTNITGHLLSKGMVVFSSNSLITKVVARAREYHTSDKINAYSPPLLFDKKIKKHIGGYYFHPALSWLEDSEFDRRVQKANLSIAYDESAKVVHPPLTPPRDLRSAFWYGVGKRAGVELGIHQKPTGLVGSAKKYIINAGKVKGLATGIYLFIWKIALFTGYFSRQILRNR